MLSSVVCMSVPHENRAVVVTSPFRLAERSSTSPGIAAIDFLDRLGHEPRDLRRGGPRVQRADGQDRQRDVGQQRDRHAA